jgi:hypothetical protein
MRDRKSAPKNALVKASMVPARSAKEMPRSMTSPSIWWKTGVWVASVDAAGHHGVDRRRRVGHQPDLHRRRVRAEQDRLGIAEVDVEGVPHPPRRVAGRDVERLEVVPVRFDLGPFGDREPHADEHVLEAVAGLGDEVEVAAWRHVADLGEVEPLGLEPDPALGRFELGLASGERGIDVVAGLVEAEARCAALVGCEPAQRALPLRERAALSEQLRVQPTQGVERGCGGDGVARLGDELPDVAGHRPEPCRARVTWANPFWTTTSRPRHGAGAPPR